MTYKLTVSDEWNSIKDSRDLWVYNKLELSQVLGYKCGPAGLPVPEPGFYIARPIINFMGMGRYSRIEHIEGCTEHLHPGEFWCEVFEGEHLSVDFCHGKPDLIVRGDRDPKDPLYRWSNWVRVNRDVKFPQELLEFLHKYKWINCEFIGDKLIEVHFRRNSDFRYGNSKATPIWNDDEIPNIPIDSPLSYIEDDDYYRKGFVVD